MWLARRTGAAIWLPGGGATRLLELCGYVRGLPLSVNRRVYVPACGDVVLEKIQLLRDPMAARHGAREHPARDGARARVHGRAPLAA